jgi:hypothetical protein
MQPGQAGFPPPPGQPGFPSPGGQDGLPPAKKKPRLVWLRILILVAVVIGVGVLVLVNTKDSPSGAAVGDCLNVQDFSTSGAEPTKVDCGAPNANVKIGVRLDDSNGSCPAGDYDFYSVSGSSPYKLCLMINAREGDCFANVTSRTEDYLRVPCGDPKAEINVVKIIGGSADEKACQAIEGASSATYSQPPTTLCFTRPHAT